MPKGSVPKVRQRSPRKGAKARDLHVPDSRGETVESWASAAGARQMTTSSIMCTNKQDATGNNPAHLSPTHIDDLR